MRISLAFGLLCRPHTQFRWFIRVPNLYAAKSGHPFRWHIASVVAITVATLMLVIAGCNPRAIPTPTPLAPSPNLTEVGTPIALSTSSTPDADVPLSPAPVSGTLLLWHSWSQQDGDALAAILNQFADQYPGVTVETLFVAQTDLLSSYAEAIEAGAGPDLLLAPNVWLRDLVTLGVIAPIDESLSTIEKDEYWPAALAGMRWEDRLFGIPVTMQTVALFYNRNLVQNNALPKTTDELISGATTQPQLGIGLFNNLFHLYWGIPAFGGALFDDTGRIILEQTNGASDYLQWLSTVSQTPGSFVSTDYGMLVDRFKKQEYAFFVDGLWSTSDLRASLGPDLLAMALPSGPTAAAQPWAYMDGLYFKPNHTSEQRTLAVLLARAISSPSAGAELAQTAAVLPANRNAQVSDEIIAGFQIQAASAIALPLRPEMEQVWGAGGDMFHKVIDAGRLPAEVIMETSTLINEANGR